MKKLLIGLFALGSFYASASPLYTCELPEMGTSLSISRSGDAFTYQFDGSHRDKVLEVIHYNRSDFQNSEELQSYMLRSGLKSVENFIDATIYVTDSNVIGKSGLMVFRGGRSRAVAMAFIMGPTDNVIRCEK